MSFEENLKKFSIELFKINGVKFGEYVTKIGLLTPIYCDLRIIISYPKLLESLVDLITDSLKNIQSFDTLCGVPYTALPIATAVSLRTKISMVMRRQEAKYHGTKKIVEGDFKEGDKCLVIEDVATSGSSILETVNDLKKCGLKCTDVVVLLNREQGAAEILQRHGIKMHALLTLTRLVRFLKEANYIDEAMFEKVQEYIKNNQVNPDILTKSTNRLQLHYTDRIPYAKNPITEELFKIMASKETNLCVAADLTKGAELLDLANQVGPHICILKTHIDIVEDFNESLIKNLQDLSEKYNFMLLEDRKFADIGKIVEQQYTCGIYKISSWAKLITAHSVTGKGVLDAIRQSNGSAKRGVFLLAETSAAENLIDKSYTMATLKIAKEYSDLVSGIVCQNPYFTDEPGFLQLTPGVQLDVSSDLLGQQYNSPESVVIEKGADIAVVGRGITKSSNPAVTAEKYKQILWKAYLQRLHS